MIGPSNPGFASFGGIHHIYVNDAAMRGYAAGSFPEGSVLVFDRFEALTSKDDLTTHGARQVVDVMQKDSSRVTAVGGWDFEEFVGSTRERASGSRDVCAKCHSTQRSHDFMFSVYKD